MAAAVPASSFTAPPPTRQGVRWRRPRRAVIGVAAAIGVWAAVTYGGLVDTENVPTVATVARGASSSWRSLLSSVGVTLESWAIGMAIATVLGIGLGLLVGMSDWADAATDVIVRMMRPLPALALIPVAILIAGLGVKMTAGLVTFAAFWPVFINTRYAVRQVQPRLLDSGRAIGLGRFGLVRRVVLPASAPAIATGIRVAVGLAVVVTVSVELVASTGGLGGYVLAAEANGITGTEYAGVIAGGIVGWLLNGAVLVLVRRALPWQAAAQASA